MCSLKWAGDWFIRWLNYPLHRVWFNVFPRIRLSSLVYIRCETRLKQCYHWWIFKWKKVRDIADMNNNWIELSRSTSVRLLQFSNNKWNWYHDMRYDIVRKQNDNATNKLARSSSSNVPNVHPKENGLAAALWSSFFPDQPKQLWNFVFLFAFIFSRYFWS